MLMEEFDVTNRTAIDVRYQETDQMGVVYHANYLVWFEIGRTKLIEQLGFTYVELENEGLLLPVINVHASYKQPVRYGEKTFIETKLTKYNGVRLTYEYEVKNADQTVCVSGWTEHALIRKESFLPTHLRRVHKRWHELLQREVMKD